MYTKYKKLDFFIPYDNIIWILIILNAIKYK